MQKYLLFFFLMFAFNFIYPQDIDNLKKEVEAKEFNLSSKANDLSKLELKYPLFKITGEIKDRDRELSFIQLWGIAYPVNQDFNTYGSLIQNGNIIVQNPLKSNMQYNYYTEGEHYFIEKRYSKNTFGGDVVVFVFGDIPDKEASVKMENLRNAISTLKSEIKSMETRISELEYLSVIKKAEHFSENKQYQNSIDSYVEALSINISDKKGLSQIIFNLSIEQSKEFQPNDLNNSIEILKKSLLLKYIDDETKMKLKNQIAIHYKEIANTCMNSNNYKEAIISYEKAVSYDSHVFDSNENLLAKSNYLLGIEELDYNIPNGMINLTAASNLDNSYKIKSLELLSSYKRSIIHSYLSIIPGLGEITQGEFGTALINIGLMGIAVYGGIQTKDKNNSQLCYDAAGLVYIFSIINTISIRNTYNKQFELLGNRDISIYPIINYKNIYFCINVKL
ncbi:MAG: hypothetical protein NTZ27_07260 [Ignavibacteriales bacterium]|nr:hypothetical protein [Ignavibacteriales bacterium]